LIHEAKVLNFESDYSPFDPSRFAAYFLALDPEKPGRHWVYLWSNEEEAQQFADELEEQTGITGWRVEKTAAPPSNGPFGPVLIQLARRSDGLVLTLHPLSLAMIRKAYPGAKPNPANAFVKTQTWNDFLRTQGNLSDLVLEEGCRRWPLLRRPVSRLTMAGSVRAGTDQRALRGSSWLHHDSLVPRRQVTIHEQVPSGVGRPGHWMSGMRLSARLRLRRMMEKSRRSRVNTVRMFSRSARCARAASASWRPASS